MRHDYRITTFALTVLVACTLASCSSGSAHNAAAGTSGDPSGSTAASPAPASRSTFSGTVGSATVDVCSLLPAAQASTINGVTYGSAAAATPAPGFATCTYRNTGQHSNPVDIQDLTVTVLSMPGCWTALKQADGPGKSVSGVGDVAFGTRIGLDVKTGSRCLTISGLTDSELLGHYGPDTAMAKIILAGLH